MSGKTKKELLKEAKKLGLEEIEDMTVDELKTAIAEASEDEEEDDDDSGDDDGEAAPAPKAAPKAAKDADILVNKAKVIQATVILDLLNGKRAPKNSKEAERLEHYTRVLESREIDPKGKDALKAVYAEVLGGAVRSPAQEAAFQKQAAKMKKSLKRKQIEEQARKEEE